MYLDRLLKYINTLIAAVLLVAMGLIYWYVYRPLPAVSGTLETLVSGNVTVTRDGLGTPHISAESLPDALFAPYVQLVSVTATTVTPVVQGADREILLLVRNYLD